ncbi:hypothetical protein CROQUDRAFT_44752, partial [Cronartium quercuum f. sp. fusiforme G11]
QKKAIKCVINVQHACAKARYEVTQSKPRIIERTIMATRLPITTHKLDNRHILHSGAFYSSEAH